MITTERLAEIAARLAARTPGEWEVVGETFGTFPGYSIEAQVTQDEDTYTIAYNIQIRANADLIVHAPADIADLLAEVARLRLQVAYLEDQLPQYGEYGPGGAAYDDNAGGRAVADDSEVTS